MNILLVQFLALVLQYSVAERSEVPVLITDDGEVLSQYKIQPNPFSKMTTSYFADLVRQSLKINSAVIIFVEDSLSTEDITSKDHLGSPFSYLNKHLQEKNLKYIPAVTHALRTLTQVFPPLTSNVFYLNTVDNLELSKSFKYIYVRFVDQPHSNKSRVARLRDHDSLIKDIYLRVKQLRAGVPIITFFTGKINPITIEKLHYRYARIRDNSDGRIVASQNALFRLAGIYSVSPFRRARFTHVPAVSSESLSPEKLSTSVTYSDFELQFNFKFRRDDWILESIALIEGDEEVGRTAMGVGAPWNSSYVCAEPIVLVNTRDGSSVTISKYQIQPLYRSYWRFRSLNTRRVRIRREDEDGGGAEGAENADNVNDSKTPPPDGALKSDDQFGDKVNCGPYFNSHILAGLFVAGILLGILFTGVILLMNCYSNDRFDNPQGKEVFTKVDGGG